MASQSLISTINGYENYIEKNGVDESVMDAYIEASEVNNTVQMIKDMIIVK